MCKGTKLASSESYEGRLSELSLTEIWKMEVTKVMSKSVHATWYFNPNMDFIGAWTLLVTCHGQSRSPSDGVPQLGNRRKFPRPYFINSHSLGIEWYNTRKSMRTTSMGQKTNFTLMLFVASLWLALPVNAQRTNELARIDVFFRSISDGQDILKVSTENKHCILFYKQGADIMFANNYEKLNSSSYGKISDVMYKSNKEKDGSSSDIFHFKWHWQNSYDSETGIADVFVKVVTSKDAIVARIIIVSSDLENVLDYGGLFMGSLNSIKK